MRANAATPSVALEGYRIKIQIPNLEKGLSGCGLIERGPGPKWGGAAGGQTKEDKAAFDEACRAFFLSGGSLGVWA